MTPAQSSTEDTPAVRVAAKRQRELMCAIQYMDGVDLEWLDEEDGDVHSTPPFQKLRWSLGHQQSPWAAEWILGKMSSVGITPVDTSAEVCVYNVVSVSMQITPNLFTACIITLTKRSHTFDAIVFLLVLQTYILCVIN